MNNNDLIRKSAELVMGWHLTKPMPLLGQWYEDANGNKVGFSNLSYNGDKFNPLTNANHTKMLKDKAVEMGLLISEVHGKADLYWIAVEKWESGKQVWAIAYSCQDKKDIGETTTEAIVEAVEKMKEQS